ncbi:MAG: SURF1 family protein [Chloroflexota bacterium]
MTFGTFISRRWRWASIAVILGMLFLVRLGVWQLDRLEWRRGLNAEKLAEMNADPLDLNGDINGLPFEEMNNRRIKAVGAYDFANQFYIEAQIFENQPGRYLLTPMLLEGSEHAVLVNRGWVPEAESDFAQFDELGTVEVIGRFQGSQTLSGDRVTQIEDGNRIFRIDVGAVDAALSYEVMPVYVLPETEEIVDSMLPYLPKADLSLDEGNHFSYALQWFSFAILLAVMYVIFVNRQEKKSEAVVAD